MRGVITRVQVLAHPLVIVESFGLKVLWRALFAGARDTFLDVVTRCAEEDAHRGMADLPLLRTTERFIGFERRVGGIYRQLSAQHREDTAAARFFWTLAAHEEGHAIVLSRVRRELRRGHLWKESRALQLAGEQAFEARLAALEAEVGRGVDLPRALEIAEAIEGSEVNVVFDTLNGCVDMRSRARFERFFVLTQHHLAFVNEGLRRLRERDGLAAVAG